MTAEPVLAGRRFSIHGQVQGVGFRDFTQREARRLKLTGYVRNLPDGSVLVCAVGLPSAVSDFEGVLRQGPRFAEVRGFSVEEMEASAFEDFRIFS